MTTASARLIGLDWGSTGLRAFLIGDGGQVLSTRSSGQGASTLAGAAAFEAALRGLAADWLDDGTLPLLACGMVGSQHGWREVTYVGCPADARQLAAQRGQVALADGRLLHIVPGLVHEPAGAPPDVMRGEETQIVGALREHPELAARSCLILPGTHSKWAQVAQGRITGFATHMTGELFALLRKHSVLGRLMPDTEVADDAAFVQGTEAARADGELSHQLFAVRTLGLTRRLPAEALADYLSGLLIGHELRGLDRLGDLPLALVGEPALCARYRLALQAFGREPALVLPNTAPAGLWELAQLAELL